MYSKIALDTRNLNNDLYFRNWSNCPMEIMILCFSHLDLRSLATCMFVNKFWLEAAKYYLQHFNLWHQMVENTISNKGALYKEKCTLQWRDILLNFFLWRNVWKARITHYQIFHIKHVRTMKVYKNNLIVVLDDQVKYLNLLNTQCNKTLNVKCFTFEESDYFVTILLRGENTNHHRSLCIQNKQYGLDVQYSDTFNLDDIGCYKLYSNHCYFIDNNTLWVAITEQCNYFSVKALAKFYGPSSIVALHVFEHKVYIVTKEGNMYYVDGLQFRKVHNIFPPLQCRKNYDGIDANSLPIPFLFNNGCAAYRVQADEAMQISKSCQLDIVIMAVPSLSALLEHGEVLILGYENGKVEIHSIYKILCCLNEPKKQFNMRDFVYDRDGDYQVKALDMYEQVGRHYLVVAIENNVHQLSIRLTR